MFFYSNLGNKENLGYTIAAVPYLTFPIAKDDIWMLSFRAGAGLAYLDKPFHTVNNFKDIAIGSTINAAISLTPQISYTISNKIILTTGVSFTHLSNGGFKTPNLGLNAATVNVAVAYTNPKAQVSPIRETIGTPRKKYQVSLIAGVGVKELYPPGEKKYFPATLTLSALKRMSAKTKLGITLDAFYDPSLVRKGELDFYRTVNAYKYRYGAGLSYVIEIGKLDIPLDFGAYILPLYFYDSSIYNRIGFRYHVTKHFLCNLTLKAHFAKADYVEAGFGYTF